MPPQYIEALPDGLEISRSVVRGPSGVRKPRVIKYREKPLESHSARRRHRRQRKPRESPVSPAAGVRRRPTSLQPRVQPRLFSRYSPALEVTRSDRRHVQGRGARRATGCSSAAPHLLGSSPPLRPLRLCEKSGSGSHRARRGHSTRSAPPTPSIQQTIARHLRRVAKHNHEP